MSIQIGITHPSQQIYKQYISEVLENIPPNNRKKICDECLVCLAGFNPADQFGFTKKDVIVLNTVIMDYKYCKDQKLHTIAHEFAHHILNHPSPMKDGMKEQHEKEANALAKEWGFPAIKKETKE